MWDGGEIAWCTFWELFHQIEFVRCQGDERKMELAVYAALLPAEPGNNPEGVEVRDEIARRIREGAAWVRRAPAAEPAAPALTEERREAFRRLLRTESKGEG